MVKYYTVMLIKPEKNMAKLAEWTLAKDQVLDIVIDLGKYK